MKQLNAGETGFERKTKRTSKRESLWKRNRVVPWAELVSLIAAYAPATGTKDGLPPYTVETMLRIHFIQRGRWRKRCLT
jgi:IS5 family transposase